MKVFNVTTGLFESDNDLCRAIVNVKDGVFELGYCSFDDPELVVCNLHFASIHISYVRLNNELKKVFVYSNYYGKYIYVHAVGSSDLRMALTRYGRGDFPYRLNKEYEAVRCFEIFNNKQKILDFKEYELAKYLKYTFGVEFESYSGYIPENLCFRDGLIPLRDGSLDGGIEYSTIVLEGNYGLNLLNQQIDTLNEYTLFNKECSLHFHFGNFPVNDIYLWSLYLVWQHVSPSLNVILPKYTYDTSFYKKSEKDYCKRLPTFNTFNEMYEAFTTQKYFGNLYQPHPKDPHQTSKWNVHGRYYCLNLINMLCYKSPKTVEFRLLRPTYNKHKIMFWLYIFNAILMTAERIAEKCKELKDVKTMISKSDFSIFSILFATYPPEIADKLIQDYYTLEQVICIQHDLNDYIGSRIDIEDKLFDPNTVI